MEVLDATDGTALVTATTSAIAANIPAVVIVLGAFIGLKVGARLLNGAKGGKVRV